MMPGQIPDPSLAAGSLPCLGPLAGISATTLTDQLKLADFRQLGSMLSPLHFLGRLGKRPLAIKTEMDEDEERRKRRREKNKVAAARCRNKKKERTDFLQRESERLEMVNSDLKAQIEELRLERQQLMVMLNLHRPTCIVRTDSVKTPEFDYDLFLHLEGHPPVNHLRCEKLTFNNPTEEFRRKLLKAGGQRDPHKRSTEDSKVMVMQEGSTSLFGQHLKLPTLPNSSLTSTFSDPKKSKSFHGSKDGSKGSGTTLLTTATTTSTNSSSFSKLHKPSKDHKDKPPKDLKEPKSAFRDSGWDPSKAPKEPSRKPKENQPLRDINPKMGFKEPKSLSKEHRTEGLTQGSGLNKRLSTPDGDDHVTKKRKRGFVDSSGKQTSGSDARHSDKKLLKDRSQMRTSKLRPEGDEAERRKVLTHPPFQELVDPNDSDMEDHSTKSDSEQPSPASSSSSSGFAPTHHKRQVLGPLQSVMQDLHSDDNDEDSEDDDDNDMDSDVERPAHTHLSHHQRRVSLSDGSESDSSSPSPLPRNEAPPLLKTTNNQILEVKSPTKQSKQDKNKNLDCDKAYLDELVELHKRLMTLREGHILQQIVNLIEETGHFHITNTTFDFDLCSLDRSTVRKLQSYLETSGLS